VWFVVAAALLAAIVAVSMSAIFAGPAGEGTAERIGSVPRVETGEQVGSVPRVDRGRGAIGSESSIEVPSVGIVGGEGPAQFHPLP
jgi:hypothetical protein